ncbi:sulfotransferase [Sphingomonas sp. LHG3406-1]|uniref:sulfotransferase family protein n=1 Tax=Sphingomonas sp. LHG3406-1 TaxID=2804617 RepID=UPI00262F550E|nr:sulfotransferase [Sphingomonas sp. LHG3406-1]
MTLSLAATLPAGSFRALIERPVFIMSSPRSGSTLLFETLAQSPGLFTIGRESHNVIEGIRAFSTPARGFTSNRLTEADADPDQIELLAQAFYERLHDRNGRTASGRVRMLEKTPKNALRVPFFAAAWPDATFLFLYRDARETIASMMEAWRSGMFRTYPRLPGWTGYPWSLLLVPGWENLKGLPLPHIVARQWATAMDFLINDLASLPPQQVRAMTYENVIAAPQHAMQELSASLDLSWDRSLGAHLPKSRTTVSDPAPDKWRANEEVIEMVWPLVKDTDEKARAFADRHRV